MANTLSEQDWEILLNRIGDGKCTPFLGAGACYGVLPLGKNIAKRWAERDHYPLPDREDLKRVAQFEAVKREDNVSPKEEVVRLFREVAPPNFTEPDEPHGFLASMDLPVYITTNYDDFMVQALRAKNKDPKLELCEWNSYTKGQHVSIFEREPDYEPDRGKPVVFHLHGYKGVPESLVLTEDDYLDFLVSISRDPNLLPPAIQRALTGASLLFIGYKLDDWDFRVLFRGLVTSMERSLRRLSVAVQLPPLPPDIEETEKVNAQVYLTNYFKETQVKVYWGTAREFLSELRRRWVTFKDEKHDDGT